MNQDSLINMMSVELLQKPQITEKSGLKANISEINHLIQLLDCPFNEIICYLKKDHSLLNSETSNLKGFIENKSDAARVTQDLDHLLTSLSQYTLSQSSVSNLSDDHTSNTGPEYLYSENLQTNFNTGDTYSLINEKLIQNCMLCNELILDNSISALNGYWHQHHFICFGCKVPLESGVYYVDNQQPYCEACNINLFTEKCAFCQEPILETSLIALDQNWHPEHFFCASCQGPFKNDVGYHEHQRKPYCSDCYFDLFGSRCAGCQEPITAAFITAMGQKWHRKCFVCKECQMPFETVNFHELNGNPYCSQHYHSKMGMVCAVCNLPILSSLVNALGKKYHMQCFTCNYCLKSLAKCTFKETKNQPYCAECFTKLCP